MTCKTIENLSREHTEVYQRLQELVKPVEELEKETGGIQQIKDFSSFLEKEITLHFEIEEKALFPALGKLIGTDSGPVYVMLVEHEDLSPKFQELVELSRQLSGSKSEHKKKIVQLSRYIINTLYNHAQKEDQILFPFAQSALTSQQGDEIDSAADKIRALNIK